MKYRTLLLPLTALLLFVLFLTGCDSATTGETAESAGKEAFVDMVTIKDNLDHFYATVNGHYPDSCSRISDVQQSVDGDTIAIVLYVAAPEELMCAQMLTPFEADILLETGGLAPGEYTVSVNEAVPATLTIGG